MKIKNIFLTIALMLIGFGSVMATPTTTQTRETVSGGGGTSTGGIYTNFPVVGEPVVGTEASGKYQGSTQGFMAVFNEPTGSPRVTDITATYTGLVAADLTVTGDIGATFVWYSDVAMQNEVATGATFAHGKKDAGVYTYYVVQIVEGVISSYATAKVTINKASLTVRAADTTRIYGQPNPEFRIIYSGFVNGETASVIDVAPIATTLATTISNAGTFAIPIDVANSSDNNYIIRASSEIGALTINKANVTFTLSNNIKNYTGLEQSATISSLPLLALGTDYTVTNNLETNVSTYPLTISLVGDALINYHMTNAAIIGDLVINKVPLSITADNKSRCVGVDNPAFTMSYSGFLNGETASVITLPTATTSANIASPSAPYDIVLSGGSATNYDITLVDGTLTVNELPIPTILADNETPAANGTVTYTTQSSMNNYTWTISGAVGTDYTKTAGSSTDNTVVITWLTAGPKVVSVNYANANGCRAAAATTKNVAVTGADVAVAVVNVSPLEQTVCLLPGVSATFNVELSGAPAPTVKWQELTTAVGATWTDLTASAVYHNVTTTALTINPIGGMSGYKFRAVGANTIVPGGDKSATSEAVTLHLTTPLTPTVAISSNPAALLNTISINSGTSVVFTATPSNIDAGIVAYQWKVNNVNVGTNLQTYTTTTLKNSDYVNCVITVSGANACLTSATATAASSIIATVLDVTAPRVTAYFPAANSVIAAANVPKLKLIFDEPIAKGISGVLRLRKVVTTGDSIIREFPLTQVDISGDTLIADLTGISLVAGNSYYASVEPRFVKDLAGNYYAGFDNDSTWRFNIPITGPTVAAGIAISGSAGRTTVTLNIGNLGTTGGRGSRVLVIASNANIAWTPTSGTEYADSLVFAPYQVPSLVGGGKVFAVYDGTNTQITVSGLTKKTKYYFKAFSYNGVAGVPSTYTYGPISNQASTTTSSKDDEEYEVGEKEFAGNFSVCKVNPNPVSTELNFCIDAQEEDNFKIELFNISGELVLSQLQFLKSGSNTMKLDLSTQKGGVPAGNYFLKVTANNESLTQQVVVIP